jgi:hypothetical protein
VIIATTMAFMAFNIAEGMLLITAPWLAKHELPGGAGTLGALLAATAAGEFVGAAIAGNIRLDVDHGADSGDSHARCPAVIGRGSHVVGGTSPGGTDERMRAAIPGNVPADRRTLLGIAAGHAAGQGCQPAVQVISVRSSSAK